MSCREWPRKINSGGKKTKYPFPPNKNSTVFFVVFCRPDSWASPDCVSSSWAEGLTIFYLGKPLGKSCRKESANKCCFAAGNVNKCLWREKNNNHANLVQNLHATMELSEIHMSDINRFNQKEDSSVFFGKRTCRWWTGSMKGNHQAPCFRTMPLSSYANP